MMIRMNLFKVLTIFSIIGCSILFGQPSPKENIDTAITKLNGDFSSNIVEVNGTVLHYVQGGTGPTIILLHGFPQDWYAFHKIMPHLAKKFNVIAIDLRGIGGSAPGSNGYEILNLAEDVHELVKKLQLNQVYVAGHDNGGMLAYSFTRLYHGDTRGVMILDSPIPGIEPWDEVKSDPVLWHFGFHQTPSLPEKLIACQPFLYFREFFNRLALNPQAITDTDVTHYVNSYAAPEQLRAGLEFYRQSYPSSEKFNASENSSIKIPLVMAGGDKGLGPLIPRFGESLRKHGWSNVKVEIIQDSGHWVMDEQPDKVSELLDRYASL